MEDIIRVENLSHRFAEKQVLNQINLKVSEGEIFGLLGPSGAGKTTLLKILTGQLAQEEGEAYLLGKDTRKLGDKERRQTGIMMDCFGLYDRLSVYSNLSFYAEIYQISKSRIWDILEEIGLLEAKNQAVYKLSKGMKNRLSLARALMADARILFLDEPTSGIDPGVSREIHHILLEQRKAGKTIFLTTHNMYEAESLCDHVALLHGGRIVEYGNPEEICRKYNDLNRFQIVLKSGEKVELENSCTSGAALKEYLEREEIVSIHSTEPTLETVFVTLTGRGLESYESSRKEEAGQIARTNSRYKL